MLYDVTRGISKSRIAAIRQQRNSYVFQIACTDYGPSETAVRTPVWEPLIYTSIYCTIDHKKIKRLQNMF